MTDIFISYSRRDIDVAQKLAHVLEELGYTVWWDMTGLHGGQAFASVIQEKLSEVKCAIVLWSPDSVKSNWVHSEATFADSRKILVTAMYRESQAPMPFNNRHNEDLRGWNGNIFDDGFQKLLKAVSQFCPAPSGQPRQTELDQESEVEQADASSVAAQAATSQEKPDHTIKAAVNTETPSRTADSAGVDKSDAGSFGLVSKLLLGAAAVGTVGFFLYSKGPPPQPEQADRKSLATQQSQNQQNPSPVTSATLTSIGSSTPVSLAKPTPVDAPVVKVAETTFTEVTKTALANAEIALVKNRLTTPQGDSVRFYAGSVLKTDPNNAKARELLRAAVDQYHRWANANLAQQKLWKVGGYLENSSQLITDFSLGDDLSQKQIELSEALITAEEAEKTQASQVYQLPNNLTLVPIPAGSFMMGSNSGDSDEKPVHNVTFAKPFWMSKTEVTFDQYDAYADATGKEKPRDRGWGRGERPVIYVSWDDAQGYVGWLSQNNDQGLQCRLPSEAEWEYAARAGTTTKYFWGDQIGKNNANCRGCDRRWGGKQTAPVGSYSANQWGLHDMHGNVWEWVQDKWHKNYTGAPNNGDAWESGDGSRVLRGGSWFDPSDGVRSADRFNGDYGSYGFGFRLVCSPIDR